MASTVYLKIKPFVVNVYEDLKEISTMTSWDPSPRLMENIELNPAGFPALLANGIEFSSKSRIDPEASRCFVKEFKKYLNAEQVLFLEFAKKEELKNFPSFVIYFILQSHTTYSNLREILPKKHKSGTADGRGNVFISSSSEFSVSIDKRPTVDPDFAHFSPPPVAMKTEASEEAVLPSPESTTSAGSFSEEGSPAFEFSLPGNLEKRFTAEEKELFNRVLTFIAAARAKGDKSRYNLDQYKQRIYVALVAGLDQVILKYSGRKNPKMELAWLFKGNEDDAGKYFTTYHHSDSSQVNTYVLRGKYPELEKQMEALIKK